MSIATTVTTRRPLTLTAVLLLAGLGACAELEQEGEEKGEVEGDLEGVQLESVEQKTFAGNLGTVTGSPIAMGNTNGLTNDFTASCITASINNTAPEASFLWTAAVAGTYIITTTGSSFDTTLEVFDTSASIACNDDNGFSLQSRVTVTLTVNQQVLINVDGWRTASGAYRLNITRQ